MIKQLDISGVHMQVDDDLRKYATRKIGRLDRYIPKHSRESARGDILLKESKAKDKKECTCEVTLHLPKEVVNVKESTINMYAAIDIIEAKLKNRLKKYKSMHGSPKFHRRMMTRIRHSATEV
jgi:putative sigma-54 modulation protein